MNIIPPRGLARVLSLGRSSMSGFMFLIVKSRDMGLGLEFPPAKSVLHISSFGGVSLSEPIEQNGLKWITQSIYSEQMAFSQKELTTMHGLSRI